MDLLLGCGSSRTMRFRAPAERDHWVDLVTLDINADHKPDVVHDLHRKPWPFADNTFEQIHAYEVLEHLGQHGNYGAFFADFSEIWRILKPGGYLVATSPGPDSTWAWGDPGHTRIISRECLGFLVQPHYEACIGKCKMTDYRFCYSADFDLLVSEVEPQQQEHLYILRAVKPSRIKLKEAA